MWTALPSADLPPIASLALRPFLPHAVRPYMSMSSGCTPIPVTLSCYDHSRATLLLMPLFMPQFPEFQVECHLLFAPHCNERPSLEIRQHSRHRHRTLGHATLCFCLAFYGK